jgi:hypothetical protein
MNIKVFYMALYYCPFHTLLLRTWSFNDTAACYPHAKEAEKTHKRGAKDAQKTRTRRAKDA